MMGWHEHWYYMTSEIAARGWRAFVYGPEAWLVIPKILGVIGLAIVGLIPGSKAKNRATQKESEDKSKDERNEAD